MNTAFISIDIQNDYFSDGKMVLPESEAASLNTKKILTYHRNKNNLIVHIKHISTREDATFFIDNTRGIEIHKNVTPLSNEKIITKHFPNAFYKTELFQYLTTNNIQHLVIAGMMTHMCVDASVRAAKDLGFTVEMIGDACATKNLEFNGKTVCAESVQTAFFAALNFYYANVLSTTQYLQKNN